MSEQMPTLDELRQWREDYIRRGQLVQPVDVTDRIAEALPHLIAIAEAVHDVYETDNHGLPVLGAYRAARAAGLFGEVGQ